MAAVLPRLRGELSAPGLIKLLRQAFHTVSDPRRGASVEHSLPDALGAALAMFHLKFPSMRVPQQCGSEWQEPSVM